MPGDPVEVIVQAQRPPLRPIHLADFTRHLVGSGHAPPGRILEVVENPGLASRLAGTPGNRESNAEEPSEAEHFGPGFGRTPRPAAGGYRFSRGKAAPRSGPAQRAGRSHGRAAVPRKPSVLTLPDARAIHPCIA